MAAAAAQPADGFAPGVGPHPPRGPSDRAEDEPMEPSLAGVFPAVVQETCAAVGSHYRRTLLDALSSIPGHKLFLLEESLAAAVSSLVDAAALQQHGVERCFALGAFPLSASSVPSQTALASTVLVLCRPKLSRLPLIARHFCHIEATYPPAQSLPERGPPSLVGGTPEGDEEALWTLPLPPIASKGHRRYLVVFVPTPSDFLAGELRRLLSVGCQQEAGGDGPDDSPSLPAAAASLISNLSSSLLPRGAGVGGPSGSSSSSSDSRTSSSVNPDCVAVTHCPLRFFPLEKDVLSLELPNFLRAFHGQGDPTTVKQAADSVVVYQEELQQNVLIPHLRCIGSAAKQVADHLIRRKREQQRQQMEEAALGASPQSGESVSSDLVPPVHSVLDASDLEEGQAAPAGCGSPLAAAGGSKRACMQRASGLGEASALLPHKANMLVVFDRRADLVTPLCTPFTYQGLLDSLLGIEGSGLDVPRHLLQQQEGPAKAPQEVAASGVQTADMVLVESGKTQRVSLAGDALYALLRDLHQSAVGGALHRVASGIQQTYREKESLRTIADISAFMPKFKAKQQEHASLSLHVKLASFVAAVVKNPAYHRRLCIEDQLLQSGGPGSSGAFDAAAVAEFEDLIDESAATEAAASSGPCSAAAATLDEVYRLLCLASVVNGGIKPKHLEPLLRGIVQQHGLPELRRMAALHNVGLLRQQPTSNTGKAGAAGLGMQRWKYVRDRCRLIVDEQQAMDDIAYACSGYAPLSIRLLQLLHETPSGWRAIPDVLNSLWGPAMEIRQQQPPAKQLPKTELQKAASAASSSAGAPGSATHGTATAAPTLVLILFLGGVTHAEIAAVRRLNEMELKGQVKCERDQTDKRQYLIVTTEILTPRRLFRSMLDAVD
ncbi:hypothetical protein Efla_004933 [Eimeria flavescens]